jgi:hypothetical protein
MGDAAIARWAECVAALEESRAAMQESHQASYRVLQSINMRGERIPSQTLFAAADEETTKVA